MLRNIVKATVALAAMVAGTANAAITEATHLTPISTEVLADASTVFTWVMPVFGTILAMIVGIKLIKRFTSKL